MFTTTYTSSVHSQATNTSQSGSSKTFQPLPRLKSQYTFLAMIGLLTLCCFALLSSAPVQAQDNIINTVAGQAPPATVATNAHLAGPAAMVEDASGNLYISAPATYYILKETPSGSLSIYAGTGIFGAGGDGSPAVKATLGGVLALALDSRGDLYLADKGAERRLRRFHVAGWRYRHRSECARKYLLSNHRGLRRWRPRNRRPDQ
jgi:hypothetical protein